MTHRAAAPLVLLLLLLVPVPVQAQGAVLDVRAEVSPSMARMRALESTAEPLVSVLAGVPSRPYPCRLVLRDGVLCRVTGFPQDAEDLQLVIEAPGFQRTLRTATRIDAVRNRRAVSLGPIHLRPATVTAGPIAISYGDSTLRLQLSVTSRDERVEVRSITLEATKPGGRCMTADPRVTYRLSSDLVVRENGDRWLVTSTATDPGIVANWAN